MKIHVTRIKDCFHCGTAQNHKLIEHAGDRFWLCVRCWNFKKA